MRYAVICAYNSRNSGMYSVDLTAAQLFSSLPADFDLCVTQGKRSKTGKLTFRQISDPRQLREYDAIVYWGDFQNNPMWGANDFATREATVAKGFERWRDLFLRLHRHLPDATPIYSIGGSLLGAEPYFQRSEIRAEFAEFVERSSGVLLRDIGSYELACKYVPEAKAGLSLGFDAASLLSPGRSLQPLGRSLQLLGRSLLPSGRSLRPPGRKRQAPKSGRYFVYVFGRTIPAEDGHRLAEQVGEKLGLTPVPIVWWRRLSYRSLIKRHSSHRAFVENLATMKGAAFALTDVYHFAIDNLVQGTAPVCIAARESEGERTLSDLKKTILYRMIEAESLYIPIAGDSLASEEQARIVERADQILTGGSSLPCFRAFDSRRDLLRESIESLLSQPSRDVVRPMSPGVP